ncbi:MAG: hypothetical protein OZ921_14485 [Sorangiineae bacterium]|nr:hypothetical protein [Sorangiineae bacterium]MEB2343309.1 hypothetical protein [Deltaproteobacteria bacterium]
MTLVATRRLLSIAAVTLAAGLAAGPARALGGEAADAKHFFDAATKAFDEGRYVDAARAFEEAFRIKPNPAPLLNAGDAWEKAGEYANAARDYQKVLKLAQSTEQDRVDAIDRLARLKPQLGTIELLGRPEQRVRLDDEEFQGGDSVFVYPGAHRVSLVDVDGARVRALNVAAGTVRSVDLASLMPAPKPRARPSDATGPDGDAGAAPGRARVGPMTWVAYGVGGAGLVGALVFGIQANSAASSFDERPNRDDYDAFNTSKLLTNVCLGVGLVGVGVGTALLVGDLKKSPAQPAREAARPAARGFVTVDVAPLRGGGALVTRGAF